jgi:uncharacterized protein YbjT (DUF2867 family)
VTEQSKRILVIGATGNVGRHVVAGLLDAGADVRALARDPHSAGMPGSVDVARGDLSDPDTLDAPLEGVGAVFLVWPFPTAEAAPAVLDAVRRHASRVVYLSSMGVRDDLERQADPINRFHAEVERSIRRSGLEWTFIRSGGMATNTLGWAPQIRNGGVVRAPYGAAARSLVHEADVAAVAVRALAEIVHGGKKYPVTGPETLTQVEQAHTIGETISRTVRWEEIPRNIARRGMLDAGWSPSVVDGILDALARFVEEPEPVFPTVEEITEVPARSASGQPTTPAISGERRLSGPGGRAQPPFTSG